MKVARTTSGKYVVEAVAKALDVLESFNGSEDLTLNQISQRVGLNKSRTFRLLHTLAQRGYVERSADGSRYRLSLKLVERAANVNRQMKEIARGFMLQLQERFNETVNLSVLDNTGHVLYVDIVESSRPFRTTSTIGCRIPAHLTAMGKALLAWLRIDDPASPHHALAAKLTPRPPRTFFAELPTIRERGYAVDKEANEPGVAGIGAVITDADGRPIAAMSLSGPLHRIVANEKKIAAALMAACKASSASGGPDLSRGGIESRVARPTARRK